MASTGPALDSTVHGKFAYPVCAEGSYPNLPMGEARAHVVPFDSSMEGPDQDRAVRTLRLLTRVVPIDRIAGNRL